MGQLEEKSIDLNTEQFFKVIANGIELVAKFLN